MTTQPLSQPGDSAVTPSIKALASAHDLSLVVFPRGNGHMTPGQVGYYLAAVLRGGTAHQLRHTFASATYANNGHDIRAVQELLGHSSVTTTQSYVAVPADALRASVNAASLAAAA